MPGSDGDSVTVVVQHPEQAGFSGYHRCTAFFIQRRTYHNVVLHVTVKSSGPLLYFALEKARQGREAAVWRESKVAGAGSQVQNMLNLCTLCSVAAYLQCIFHTANLPRNRSCRMRKASKLSLLCGHHFKLGRGVHGRLVLAIICDVYRGKHLTLSRVVVIEG